MIRNAYFLIFNTFNNNLQEPPDGALSFIILVRPVDDRKTECQTTKINTNWKI